MPVDDDILGHTRELAHLRLMAERGRLHHAYLFEGPAGVGKHRVARWLSRLVNCESEEKPCGHCSACITIAANNHPDIVVIEPASGSASKSIPVAAIREVIRTTGYHRYSAKRRMILIDPADAMAPAAANALLKTLEEPPDGTGFVLVTTRSDALLPTIRSRCQRIRFGVVPEAELVAWLADRGIDNADAIARFAGGCPGRALSLAEGELAERHVLRDQLLQVLGGDLGGIFKFSETLTRGSRSDWTARVETVLELLEELLRDTVVASQASKRALLHEELRPVLSKWGEALWPGGIEVCRRAINDARRDLASYVTGKTALDALFTAIATELGRARKAGLST